MTPRQRRMMADYNKIKENFTGSKYVKVEPIYGNPPEKYRVTFNLKGLCIENGKIVERHQHIAEITLTNEYPREKPKCNLLTPIWHPNFGSYICIGDHWAAGESLSDVIVQIGDMIQYKEYNPKSPLNAQAARWSVENKNLFPLSNIDIMNPAPEEDDIEIVFNDTPSTNNAKPNDDFDDIDIKFN
ncbi:MAG: hypothetical protein IJS60_09520 [Abditibacteriota bacterium]|nr:hypothetical protein [Abditibacteriota bacterium]